MTRLIEHLPDFDTDWVIIKHYFCNNLSPVGKSRPKLIFHLKKVSQRLSAVQLVYELILALYKTAPGASWGINIASSYWFYWCHQKPHTYIKFLIRPQQRSIFLLINQPTLKRAFLRVSAYDIDDDTEDEDDGFVDDDDHDKHSNDVDDNREDIDHWLST